MARQTKRSSASSHDEQQPSRKQLKMTVDVQSDEGKSREDSGSSRNVRVVARIRPMSSKEQDKKVVVTTKDTSSVQVDQGGHSDMRNYDYDSVFGPQSTQIQVYQDSGAKQAVCQDILQGFNCTILAYGQTGSGKTCKYFIPVESFFRRSFTIGHLSSQYCNVTAMCLFSYDGNCCLR